MFKHSFRPLKMQQPSPTPVVVSCAIDFRQKCILISGFWRYFYKNLSCDHLKTKIINKTKPLQERNFDLSMPGDNFSAYDSRQHRTLCGRLWAPKSRKYVIAAVGAIFVLILIIALASGGSKKGIVYLFKYLC
jgi:hypothetical protein